MSVSRSDVRFQRDQSRVGKQRAMTTIRQRNPGPERLLSLRDQDQDQRTERRFVSFMGPAHSDMMDADALGRSDPRANTRPRGLTATKKQRVMSDAERLLDEIYGRASAVEDNKEGPEPMEPDPEPEAQPPEESQPAPVTAEEPAMEEPATEEEPAEEETKADGADEEESVDEDEEDATVVEEAPVAEESSAPPPVAEEEQVADSAPRQPTECKGWLEKFAIGRSGATGSKNWKRRYFALTASSSSSLEYFETDAADAERKGSVPIDTASSRLVRRPNKNTHAEAAVGDAAADFVVVFVEDGKERKLLLRCETAAEHLRWTEELALRVGLVDAASDLEAPPVEPEDEEVSTETQREAATSAAAAVDADAQSAAEVEEQKDPGPQALGGWMEKFAVGKSGATGAKNWKRRWFVLPAETTSKAMLTYHEKEGGKSKALGKVPVNDGKARLVISPTKSTHAEAQPTDGRDLVIVFFEDSKEFKLLLRLDTKEDHAKWAAELRQRVSLVDHPKDL